MQTPDFSEYLNSVTGGIFSKKERESVKAELADHLFIKYELLCAQGKSEAEAIKAAEEALGDKNVLRHELAQVHAYRPDISMKKALNLVIAGLILCTFHFNLFEGMEQLTGFLGSVLTLTGVFCLAKANITLKKAFAFYTAHAVLTYAAYAFSPLYDGKLFIHLPLSVTSAVCQCAGIFFLLKGLQELIDPYEEVPHKPLHFGLTTGINIISTLSACVSSLILSPESYSAKNYSLASDAFVLLFPVLLLSIIGIILLLLLLSRANKLLYASDHEYRIEDNPKKKAAFALGVCVFAVGLSLAAGYICLTPSPKLSPITKINGDKTTVDIMKTYGEREYETAENGFGFPGELFPLLTDEELARYKNLRPCPAKDTDGRGNQFQYAQYYGEWFEEVFVFPLDKEHGEFRLLRRIVLPKTSEGYRALIATQLSSYIIPLNENDTFIRILSPDENGRLCEQKPLKLYRNDLGVTYAFEFAALPETQIIIGKSYSLTKAENTMFNYSTMLLTFQKPIFGMKRSLAEICGVQKGSDIFLVDSSSCHTIGVFQYLLEARIKEGADEE